MLKTKQKHFKINKTVTVIIRTHNSERFVRKAIESVLNQDISPRQYEILVIDDGSTDATRRILKSYGRKIRLIEQKGLGYVRAINYGIINARCPYVILLDADDIFQPSIILEMSRVFTQEKDLSFVYCDYYERDTENKKTRIVSLKNIFNSVAAGIMFKKNVLRAVGMYDENFVFPEYDLLIKITKKYKGKHIPKPLFTYHRHESSLTADRQRVRLGRRQLFAKYGNIKGLRDY